ncbi:Peroxisomal 2,4-dienoyl-CoA reductase, partial [Geranomyces michiganensis]
PILETVGLAKLSAKSDEGQLLRIPVQPCGRINDIEHATLFILSPGARFISGEIMVVDGGHWLTNSGVAPDNVWKTARL